MNSNLMNFEGHEVEVFEFEGKVLFNPYHVGSCLELDNVTVRRHIQNMNEKQVIKLKNSNVQNMNFRKLHNTGENFLTESGVYKLIFKSRKDKAEKFQNWVTDEVLPQIRKTGGYIVESREAEFIDKYFPSFTEETKLLMVHDLHNQNMEYKRQLDEQEPLVDFARNVSDSSNLINMGKLAKLLKDEHINIGRNRLFDWLRKNKILMDNNTPYQRYIESGYFKVKESIYDTAYGAKTIITTLVTGKGQIYITEKLRKEFGSIA